jgi:hypothetical protein
VRGIGGSVATAIGWIALCASMALAGCGSSSEGDSDGTGIPEPSQPIAEQVPVFERAASQFDCQDALGVVHPALLPEPGAGASQENCRDARSRLRTVEGFRAGESAEYGTGAVVDGEADGSTVSLIFALDDSGQFKWISGTHARSEVGTEPARQISFDPAPAALLEALRADDCRAAFATIAPETRLSYGGEKEFCAKFEDTFTSGPEGFGSRLQADPDAKPVFLGATRDEAFYGVATQPAGYRTLIVNGAAKGDQPTVYDVVPAER